MGGPAVTTGAAMTAALRLRRILELADQVEDQFDTGISRQYLLERLIDQLRELATVPAATSGTGTLPLGPITDRERLGWQRRAVRVLAELLDHAQASGLPVVAWPVSPSGAGLAARCLCLGQGAAKCRVDFDAWCAALGASRSPERIAGTTTLLHAVAKHYDGLVTVAVAADLFDVDDDQDHEAHLSAGPAATRPTGHRGGEGGEPT